MKFYTLHTTYLYAQLLAARDVSLFQAHQVDVNPFLEVLLEGTSCILPD